MDQIKIPLCENCNSADIYLTTTARWDVCRQQWRATQHDATHIECCDCKGTFRLKWFLAEEEEGIAYG